MTCRLTGERVLMHPQGLSYWLAEAVSDGVPPTVPLTSSISADVCIVGGGFTGLWSAIAIKQREPAARVVIVERGLCGSGASGRNGGFVLSLWAKFLALEKRCGIIEAVRIASASSDAVSELGRFCAAHDIDADFRRGGWLWSATSNAQRGAWAETLAALSTYGHEPFEQLDRESLAALSGSQRHVDGIVEPIAAGIQPARLALGLRRVALELGVEIFEYSPMRSIKRKSRPQVDCAGGRVTADRVIIALNAWGVMLAEIRKAIAVVSSDIVVTQAMPDALRDCGWRDGLVISDSRMLVHYYRTTRDGRVLFGKGGGSGTLAYGAAVGPEFDGPSPIAATVQHELGRTYPALANAEIEQSWTGPIDRSKDGLPMFGHLNGSPQIFYGVGYSGNGVGPSILGGRILASLALGTKDEWSECGLVQPLKRAFPPEPFRYLGGKLVRSAVARRDRADDAGRKSSLVTRSLAGLAPGGLSPVRDVAFDAGD